MENDKKCKRNGCKKPYKENENNEQACNYHPGKPIFHDLKKGWTCCNQIVYDWDDFQKLKTCAVGAHTDQEVDSSGEFYKSSTVSNAQKGIDKFDTNNKPIKSIDEFNREQEEKRKREEQEKEKIEKKIFITPSGKHKCVNKGCLKEFDPNEPGECNFHSGEPIFHDLKKFWSCCKIEKYDWDEFMKIPTCSVGNHKPKYV